MNGMKNISRLKNKTDRWEKFEEETGGEKRKKPVTYGLTEFRTGIEWGRQWYIERRRDSAKRSRQRENSCWNWNRGEKFTSLKREVEHIDKERKGHTKTSKVKRTSDRKKQRFEDQIQNNVKWRLLLLLLRKKQCSSFVWNSQGAVFYSHRSERQWFADCRHIFYFSQKKRHVKKKKQLVQDLIPHLSIFIHMCTLYTYANIYMPRFRPSGFFGPSRCLIPTPGLTSKYPICVVCVCACVYTHTHTHTLPPALKIENTQTTPLSFLLSRITPYAKQ